MTETEKGSATVEAALIMGILLQVLIGCIYLTFYVHDRAVLEETALEAAAAASVTNPERQLEKAGQYARQLIERRLLGTRNVKADVQKNKDQIVVQYTGTFPVPGWMISLFKRRVLILSVRAERSVMDPGSVVRKIQGVKKLVTQEGEGT